MRTASEIAQLLGDHVTELQAIADSAQSGNHRQILERLAELLGGAIDFPQEFPAELDDHSGPHATITTEDFVSTTTFPRLTIATIDATIYLQPSPPLGNRFKLVIFRRNRLIVGIHYLFISQMVRWIACLFPATLTITHADPDPELDLVS